MLRVRGVQRKGLAGINLDRFSVGFLILPVQEALAAFRFRSRAANGLRTILIGLSVGGGLVVAGIVAGGEGAGSGGGSIGIIRLIDDSQTVGAGQILPPLGIELADADYEGTVGVAEGLSIVRGIGIGRTGAVVLLVEEGGGKVIGFGKILILIPADELVAASGGLDLLAGGNLLILRDLEIRFLAGRQGAALDVQHHTDRPLLPLGVEDHAVHGHL